MSQHLPPRGQPAPPQEPKRGIEVGLLPFIASIVGLVLVLAAIGGAFWFTRDGDDGPVATKTAPTQPEGALSGKPELAVEVEGRSFTYTVTYDQYRDGDSYSLETGPSSDAVSSGQAFDLIDGEQTKQFTVGEGKQQCGRVRAKRGSQYSPWSEVTCGTAARDAS